jgi:hypothetical protein
MQSSPGVATEHEEVSRSTVGPGLAWTFATESKAGVETSRRQAGRLGGCERCDGDVTVRPAVHDGAKQGAAHTASASRLTYRQPVDVMRFVVTT